MLELQALGPLDLRGEAGPLRPVLAQPKRAALLAYLILARPRGYHRRDTLLALFWPELDEHGARNALSQSLYFLRRALPDGTLLTRGAEEVGVDRERVGSDVAAFEEAVAEERWADALELYRGELLAGLHVAGAAGFERWLEVERERLHELAAEAAWAQANARLEAGATVEAERAAQRALLLAPTDESSVRAFIERLAAAGDRAAALRFYEKFAALLASELEIEPSPETVEVVAAVRNRKRGPSGVPGGPGLSGRPPDAELADEEGTAATKAAVGRDVTSRDRPQAGGGRRLVARRGVMASLVVAVAILAALAGSLLLGQREPRPPQERTSIAVLPFDNLSPDPDDEYFVEGIHDEIINQLGKVSDLAVTSRTSVMEYRDHPGDLREIAAELGVENILEGTVRQAGGRVRITAQLIDARADEHLWAGSYEMELGDIFAVQGDLAREVTAALRATLSGAEAERIAREPTDDPQAYDHYLRAKMLFFQGREAPALAYLDSAVSLDSAFAQAWALRGWLRVWGSDYGGRDRILRQAKDDIDRAVALNPDLPETQLALGYYHYLGRREYAEALEHFKRARRLQPSNAEATAAVGLIRRRQGQWDEAVEQLRRAAELDPRWFVHLTRLGFTNLLMRRYDEAERYFDRALALNPGRREANEPKVTLYAKQGNIERAREALATAVDRAGAAEILREFSGYVDLQNAPYVRILAADLGGLLQDTAIGVELRDKCLTCYQRHRAVVAEVEGQTEVARAYYDSLLAHYDSLLAESGERVFEEHWARAWIGLYSAYLGDKDRALEAAEGAVESLPVSKDAVVGATYLQILAEVYTLTGEHEKAIEALDTLLSIPSQLSVPILRLDPLWDPLRSDPRFEALLAKYE